MVKEPAVGCWLFLIIPQSGAVPNRALAHPEREYGFDPV
jgi:hypothetical protein